MLMVVWGDRVKKQKQMEKQAWTQLLWLPAALLEASEPSHSCRRPEQHDRREWGGKECRGQLSKQWNFPASLKADSAKLTWLARTRDILVLPLGAAAGA